MENAVRRRRSLHRIGSEDQVKIESDQSIFTRGIPGAGGAKGRGRPGLAMHRTASVQSLNVDEQTKAKIDKVQARASVKDFVAPIEMPYLHIPANVPWTFRKLGGSLKQSAFQIIVPPSDKGCRDRRVKIMTSKEKEKNMRQVTTMIGGRKLSFMSVIQQDEIVKNNSDFYGDDYHAETSSVATTGSKPTSMKHAQLFVFICENPHELAVYAGAALKLGRMFLASKRFLSLSLPKQDSRVRDVQRMEVAAQVSLITGNRSNNFKRDLSSIGSQVSETAEGRYVDC